MRDEKADALGRAIATTIDRFAMEHGKGMSWIQVLTALEQVRYAVTETMIATYRIQRTPGDGQQRRDGEPA